MKLLVGLGNPGERYKNTRHNAGFMLIDYLMDSINNLVINQKSNYILSKGSFKGEKIFLLKPLTFMNLSGNAVKEVMDYYHIEVKDLLVIFDDISLPLGKIRYRPKGSAGGHNGVKSIINVLKTDNFSRLKIGVKSDLLNNIVDFVLSDFSEEEKKILNEVMAKAKESILFYLETNDIEKTMGKYN